MKFKKILLFSFLILNSLALRGYSDDLFEHLDDKLSIAQDEFEEMYQDLFRQDFFPKDDKKLLLPDRIHRHISQTGPVLLNLIEWVQKNKSDDPVAQTLVNKLSRYFYFVFRDFVNELSSDKGEGIRLNELMHGFYKFKISDQTDEGKLFKRVAYPFRPVFTKAIIFILTVNTTDLTYKEKIKHIVYFLDKIRREMFDVKNGIPNCSLKDKEIDDFIGLLQTNSVPEPWLMLKHFTFLFKAMAVIFVCMIIIVLVLYFATPYIIEQIRPFSKELADRLEAMQNGAVDKAKDMKDGFLDTLEGYRMYRWVFGTRPKPLLVPKPAQPVQPVKQQAHPVEHIEGHAQPTAPPHGQEAEAQGGGLFSWISSFFGPPYDGQ